MKNLKIRSLLIGALLAAVTAWSIGAASANKPAWEYKVIGGRILQAELEKTINTSVDEGWELVSVSGPTNEMWGMAVLKREKPGRTPTR